MLNYSKWNPEGFKIEDFILFLSNKIDLISFSLLLESDSKKLGLNVPNGDCLKKIGGIAKLNKES